MVQYWSNYYFLGVNMGIGTFYCYVYGVDRKGLKKKKKPRIFQTDDPE